MSELEVRVPDIGDFDDVDVIDVHVKAGDTVAAEDPLITLETDKASMDVPAPQPGKVVSVALKRGAKVKAGDVILTLAPSDAGVSAEAPRAGVPVPEPPQGARAGASAERATGAQQRQALPRKRANRRRRPRRVPLRLRFRLARARRALPTRRPLRSRASDRGSS